MIFFRKAVLMIHGYAGGTYDQELLANYLERHWNLDVYSFTLPGHIKLSLKSAKYSEWIKSSEKMIEKLVDYGYKDIYLVGHSMGGVIACYLASKYKCVKKVVLGAPAFSYLASSSNVLKKIKDGVNLVKNNDSSEVITRFFKLPVTSINQFKLLIEKYKSSYLGLSVPTLILHGDKDTVVPLESSVKIYNDLNVKRKKMVVIKGATHDIFRLNSDEAIMEVDKFLT